MSGLSSVWGGGIFLHLKDLFWSFCPLSLTLIIKFNLPQSLDERDGLSTSLEQSQKMVQTCNTELNNLKGQLAAAYQQISALQESKEEVGTAFSD